MMSINTELVYIFVYRPVEERLQVREFLNALKKHIDDLLLLLSL